MEDATAGLAPEAALAKRREMIQEVDAQGLIATPANSYINELVVEAARSFDPCGRGAGAHRLRPQPTR